MVKCEHRLDMIAFEYPYDLLIVIDNRRIPDVFLGLNPAPFERKTVGIHPEVLQKRKVLLIQSVMIGDFRILA
jgi:hypothetical protein